MAAARSRAPSSANTPPTWPFTVRALTINRTLQALG